MLFNNPIRVIVLAIASLAFLLLAFQAYSVRQATTVCKSYTIYSSDGYSWSGTNCWEEYNETGSGGGGSTEPDGGGSGGTGGSDGYEGTPTDENADNVLDCWKDVTEDGDYHLDDGDDFGPRTINGITKPHNGIDIAANLGTTIYSPARGKVISISQSESINPENGAFVRMRFYMGAGYYEAVMIHMKEHSVIVNVGDQLVPGQPIGQVNNTGSSSGNHLHLQIYEVIYNSGEPSLPGEKPSQSSYERNPIDPLSIMGDQSCQKQS